MRERDKGEEEIVGDATILMLFDKIIHVSFPATAESPCLFLAFKSPRLFIYHLYCIYENISRKVFYNISQQTTNRKLNYASVRLSSFSLIRSSIG